MGRHAWSLVSRLGGKGSATSIQIARSQSSLFMALAKDEGEEPLACAEGILKNVLTLTWTAFETLSADLWRRVSTSGHSAIRVPTPKELEEKISFITRSKILRSYRFLFPKDRIAFRSCLAGDDVNALAVMRNVLVHSAGVIDGGFMVQGSKVPMLMPFIALGIDAKIELDGSLVRDLVCPIIAKGFDLVSAIDNWLQTHK